jgi:predicted RNase H-like HicB family nuclease
LTTPSDAPTLKAKVAMKTYSFKVVVEPDEDAAGNPAWYAYCPALESIGGATSGRTKEEALKNINEVVHMIVREFIEDGKPLPEGPEDSVEVAEVSQEAPRIAVTV